MDNDKNSDGSEESSSISEITGAIGTFFGHWPATATKNLAKALGYLVIVPKTYLDVWAAEKKANSEASILITKATGKSLAKAVEKSITSDTSLIDTAKAIHTKKILRQQENVGKIVQHAVEETEKQQAASAAKPTVGGAAPPSPSDEDAAEISEDWLNAFESEAVNMSSEQMQFLFGKVLAAEIRKPKTFSIRTIKLLAELDQEAAVLFRKLCSLSFTVHYTPTSFPFDKLEIFDSRVIAVKAPASANGLSQFGLSFADLNILIEYGLIVTDLNCSLIYGGGILQDRFVSWPVDYMDTTYNIVSMNPTTEVPKEPLRFNGVLLSKAGRELLTIVEKEENASYTEALNSFLKERGFELLTVDQWASPKN